MSIFNRVKTTLRTNNHEGRQAFAQHPETELISLLLTSFLQDQFYRNRQGQYDRIVELLATVEPEFAAKAAIFARREYGMRTITHVLAAHLAPRAAGKSWAKRFYDRVVFRPDDMLEITALLRQLGAKHLPNAVRRGFAASFDRFDGYQLAKYRKQGADVALVDLVNLVHPVPTKRNARALQQLVNGTLRNTRTWEAKLSAAGQADDPTAVQTAKSEAWTDLLTSGRIGYFALVRNLRNIVQTAPELAERAAELLTDARRVRESKVFPFRLLTADQELAKLDQVDTGALRTVRAGLDDAIALSFANLPVLENTLVAVDNSGSMNWTQLGKSGVKLSEIGALFGLALARRSNADLMEFGDRARYLKFSLRDGPLQFARTFSERNKVGHGTNFQAIFRQAAKRPYDRIVILSDMQSGLHDDTAAAVLAEYRRRSGANPWVYAIDLAGYGKAFFPTGKHRVVELAGFSEKLFELIGTLEQDREALVRRVRRVEL